MNNRNLIYILSVYFHLSCHSFHSIPLSRHFKSWLILIYCHVVVVVHWENINYSLSFLEWLLLCQGAADSGRWIWNDRFHYWFMECDDDDAKVCGKLGLRTKIIISWKPNRKYGMRRIYRRKINNKFNNFLHLYTYYTFHSAKWNKNEKNILFIIQ